MLRLLSCWMLLLQTTWRMSSLCRPTRVRCLKKCTDCKGDHGSGFKDCPKYIEAKVIVCRATEENMSYHDALINMRKMNVKTRSMQLRWTCRLETSTSTAPGQTMFNDDTWPSIINNTNNTSQHNNISCPSLTQIVQSKGMSIAIQVDIGDGCLKSIMGDSLSQAPLTAAARGRSHNSSSGVPSGTSYDVVTHIKSYLFIYLLLVLLYRPHVLTPRSSWQVHESAT